MRSREAATRRLLSYPPYGHLVRVLCEDPSEERSLATTAALRELLDRAGVAAVEVRVGSSYNFV